MRAIFITAPLVLLAACSSSADTGRVLAPPTSITASLPSSPTESPAIVPEGMTVPLIAWNREQRLFELALVDPATGNPIPDRLPMRLTEKTSHDPTLALSPDGSRLAVLTGVGSACEHSGIGTACRLASDELRLIDLRTGREAITNLPTQPPAKGWADPLAFSVDGKRLALAYHDRTGTTAFLFDAATGQLLGRQALTIRPRLMEFTADGAWVVAYGSPLAELPTFTQPGPPSALLMDGETLELKWSVVLPDILDGGWCQENCTIDRVANSESGRLVYWSPALAFDPEAGRLQIVHADENRLTTVDVLNRSLRSHTIGRAPTWIERLLALTAEVAEAKGWPEGATKSAVLSPDGTRLYIVGQTFSRSKDVEGNWQGTSQPLGLTVVETRTGYELVARESGASRIRMSGDSRYLILDWALDGSIEMLEAESLRVVSRVEDWSWDVVSSRRLGGQPVLLATQYGEAPKPTLMAMLAPGTFALQQPWSVSGLAFWVPSP